MATIGDSLEVKVSAATADFQSSMNRVEDKLEEVADESDQTSRAFGRLSTSAGIATASLQITGATAAIAAGSFGLLATTLAPLAVVFGGIAAAAGSLGAVFAGLGIVGVATHTQELKTALQEARAEIMEIIEPLGEVFGPLLVDAVEALPALVQNIVDSLGPLDEFRQSLVRMGNIAFELIPQITSFLFDLAETTLPLLNDALTTVQDTGPAAFNELADVFNRVFPLLVELGNLVVEALPVILELGTVVLETLIPAILDLSERLAELEPFFMDVLETGQQLLNDVIEALEGPVRRLARAILNIDPRPFITLAQQALPPLIGAIGGLVEGVRFFIETWNRLPNVVQLGVITAATAAIATLSSGIAGVVAAISAAAVIYNKALKPAFTALKNFLADTIIPAFQGFADAIGQFVEKPLETLGSVIRSTVEGAFDILGIVKNALGAVVDWLTKDAVPDIVGAFQSAFSATVATAFDLVGIMADAFDDFVGWVTKDATPTAVNAFTGAFGTLLSTAIDLPDIFATAFSDFVDWLVGDGLPVVADTFVSTLEGFISGAFDITEFIIEGFAGFGRAVAEGAREVLSALAELGNAVFSTIKQAVIDGVTAGLDAVTPEIGAPTGGGAGAAPGAGPGFVPGRDDFQIEEQSTQNQSVVVRVEGDTSVIEDVTAEVIAQKEDTIFMNTGGTTQI